MTLDLALQAARAERVALEAEILALHAELARLQADTDRIRAETLLSKLALARPGASA